MEDDNYIQVFVNLTNEETVVINYEFEVTVMQVPIDK